MAALTELDGWVEHVEAAAVAGVDAMLRESGFVQPPTVIPEWEPVARAGGGPLPGPVSRLLALWREPRTWT